MFLTNSWLSLIKEGLSCSYSQIKLASYLQNEQKKASFVLRAIHQNVKWGQIRLGWHKSLLRTKDNPELNMWGVKSFSEFHVLPGLSCKLREVFDGWKWMQAFIVNSSLFMHCTALHWWFAPSIVMWLASAETFSPCAACALHYGCVFVCLCYWLPSPALLCNAKLIWPVVFLSGKSLHFSCNPSQWRSYWELSTVPTEQCAHMNRQCVCLSLRSVQNNVTAAG